MSPQSKALKEKLVFWGILLAISLIAGGAAAGHPYETASGVIFVGLISLFADKILFTFMPPPK